MKEYYYFTSGNAPYLYPSLLYFGVFWYGKNNAIEIPKFYPFHQEWGTPNNGFLFDHCKCLLPKSIDIVWLSIVERKFYSVQNELPYELLKDYFEKHKEIELQIVTGMAPFGSLAIWLYNSVKAYLISHIKGVEVDVSINDFIQSSQDTTLENICNHFINSDPRVRENLEKNGLPPRDLFDNYMKQFTYRYQVVFGLWDEEKEEWLSDDMVKQAEEAGTVTPELDYIEEALFDGTHDKLHDGGLMNFHEAGKPKKLAIKWHIKKSEYSAYFWFEDDEIRAVYDRFYGAHPDTKTDFMIRIDSEKNKYELALYRYGLKEPQVITEKTYQLLVFRNKFECFRSENYNQERGAWIW